MSASALKEKKASRQLLLQTIRYESFSNILVMKGRYKAGTLAWTDDLHDSQ